MSAVLASISERELSKKPKSSILRDLETCGFTGELIIALHMNHGKFSVLANELCGGSDGGFLDILKANRISLAEIGSLWQEYNINKGKIRVSTDLPEIMGGIAYEAKGTEKLCGVCKGLGRIEDEDETFPSCDMCDGTGKVFRAGDRSAQKLTLETLGLLDRKPSINVGPQAVNFSFANIANDLTDLMKSPIIDITPGT